MRAALRLLEEREARIGALRAALVEGEESGPSRRLILRPSSPASRNAKPHEALRPRRVLAATSTTFGTTQWNRWGLDQAETYTRQLWKCILNIADSPTLGRKCDEVRTGYRQYPSGSHALFYRLIDDGIDIVRILHERMDYERNIP